MTDAHPGADAEADASTANDSSTRGGVRTGFALDEFIGRDTTIERPSLGDVFDLRGLSSRHWVGIAALVTLALFPLLIMFGIVGGLLGLRVARALFFATFVISWDLVSGYTGEISFGHALFFGVGGYASGMLNIYLGLDPLITIPLGMIAAALAGLIIGFPSLRLEGPYFSLITLVVPIILLNAFLLYPEITGGANGLISADAPRTVRDLVYGAVPHYYLAFGVFLVGLFVSLVVTRSSAGNVLTAIRADETAVSASGLNPAKFKILAFVLSGAIGGLAGAVFVHSIGAATPGLLLTLVLSIEVIIAAILGGIGTITGAAVGGLFFFLLRSALRNVGAPIPVLGVPVSDLYFLIFGIITLLFIFFLPEGIVPRLVYTVRGLRSDDERDREGGGGEKLSTDGGERPEGSRSSSRAKRSDGGRTPLERVVEKFSDDLRELIPGRGRR